MSLNTHIRYTLTCDKCGSFYRACNNRGNEQFPSSKLIIFCAKQDGWDVSLSSNGRSYDCICPDCKGKDKIPPYIPVVVPRICPDCKEKEGAE